MKLVHDLPTAMLLIGSVETVTNLKSVRSPLAGRRSTPLKLRILP
ncbi:MAG TPA: hypothetical protein V6D12_07980 [Candidatus Obscuribacterales bacterium]